MIRKIVFSGTLFIAMGLLSVPASASVPATVGGLDGKQFVSTSVKGPGKPPKKVRLAFNRGTVYDENFEVVDEDGPIMLSHAGCNIMGAGYEVEQRRLRWNQPVSGTNVGCSDDRDRWMYSRLMYGLTATLAGKNLILKGKRGVVIRLKPKHWFG